MADKMKRNQVSAEDKYIGLNLSTAITEEGVQKLSCAYPKPQDLWKLFKKQSLQDDAIPQKIKDTLMIPDQDRKTEDWAQVNQYFLHFIDGKLFNTDHLHLTEAHLKLWFDTMARCKGSMILPCLLFLDIKDKISSEVEAAPASGKRRKIEKKVTRYYIWMVAVHPMSHLISPDEERRLAIRSQRKKKVEQKKEQDTKTKAHYGSCPILFVIWGRDAPDIEHLSSLEPLEYQDAAMKLILERMRPDLITFNATRTHGVIDTDADSIHKTFLNQQAGMCNVPSEERAKRRLKTKDEKTLQKYIKRRGSKFYAAQTGTEMFRLALGIMSPFAGRILASARQKDARLLKNVGNIIGDYLEEPLFWVKPEKYFSISEQPGVSVKPETLFSESVKNWDGFISSPEFQKMRGEIYSEISSVE